MTPSILTTCRPTDRGTFSGDAFQSISTFLALLCGGLISTAPVTNAALLTNGSLTLDVSDTNGAINDVSLSGINFFRLGTFVSDFGLQSGTDTSSFRINTAEGRTELTTATSATPSAITVSGSYNYNGGVNVSFERAYTLVPGQNAIQISTRFVNLGLTSATLRYFETYDPDQGVPDYSTVNSVYSVGGKPAARATATNGATFIIGGSTPGLVLASGGPFRISVGNDLNSFFDAPVNGANTSADEGTHIGYAFSLTASSEITLTHTLAFGTTLANAEAAFVGASTTGSFRAGMNSNGNMGIENLGPLSITSLNIKLFNDTFFDTTDVPPGVASTGWSVLGSTGGASATLPSNVSTDGQTTADISFADFDAADAIHLGFDLDLFASPDGFGNPLGAQITAMFSDGSTATVTLGSDPVTIDGVTYAFGSTSAIPEPSTYALLALGAGVLLMAKRRRRVVSH